MTRMLRVGVLGAMILGAAGAAQAATYYVSKSGSNANSCATATSTTQANQKLTITAGLACLTAGDTLLIHAGTYDESFQNPAIGGSYGASWATKIRVANVPSETVWITPTSGDYVLYLFSGQQYVELDGLNMDGTHGVRYSGIKIEGGNGYGADHIRIQNAEIIYGGSMVDGSVGVQFQNNQSTEGATAGFNELINLNIHATAGSNFSYCLYIGSSDNLIERDDIHACRTGNQVYSYYNGNPSRNVIRKNKFHDIVLEDTVNIPGQIWALLVEGTDNQVYDNLFYTNGTSTFGDGIQLYGNALRTLVYNNTIYSNVGRGVFVASGSSSSTIRNNISYLNGTNYSDSGTSTTHDHNLEGTNPLFVNAGSADFHLQSGSAARNAGLTIALVSDDYAGVLRPTESAYEIGAFEYVSTSLYTPADAAALTSALASAVCGDTINLTAGVTYVGDFLALPKTCPGPAYITLQTAPSGSLPSSGTRTGPSYTSVLANIQGTITVRYGPNQAYWQFINLKLTRTSGSAGGAMITIGEASANQNTLAKVPDHIIVDRIYIDVSSAVDQHNGVSMHCSNCSVINSYIAGIKLTGSEAQAILGTNGPGPFTIDNNWLEGSTQTIMFGGGDPSITNLVPADITVTNNYLNKPLEWNPYCATGAETGCGGHVYAGTPWFVKNCFELKNARRVTFSHNICNNSFPGAQDGGHLVLTVRNQGGNCTWCSVDNITVTNNIFRHGGKPLTLLINDNLQSALAEHDITISNNLFYDFAEYWEGFLGTVRIGISGYQTGAQNFVFEHNTYDTPTYDANVGMFRLDQIPTPLPGFVIRNNMLSRQTYGFSGECAEGNPGVACWMGTGGGFTFNVLASDEGNFASLYPATNFAMPTFTVYQQQFRNRSTGDYRLIGTSPYHNAASDGIDVGYNPCNGLFPDPAGDGKATFSCGGAPPPPPPPPPDVSPGIRPPRIVCADTPPIAASVVQGTVPVRLCSDGKGVTAWAMVVNGVRKSVTLTTNGLADSVTGLKVYTGSITLDTPGVYTLYFLAHYGTAGDGPLSDPFLVTVLPSVSTVPKRKPVHVKVG